MQLKDMTIWDVFKRAIKKIIIECVSLKFWAIAFVGWLNAHIIFADHKFDLFGMGSFLLLLGIREGSDLVQQKIQNGGGGK